jgi:hypothetical protein
MPVIKRLARPPDPERPIDVCPETCRSKVPRLKFARRLQSRFTQEMLARQRQQFHNRTWV